MMMMMMMMIIQKVKMARNGKQREMMSREAILCGARRMLPSSSCTRTAIRVA